MNNAIKYTLYALGAIVGIFVLIIVYAMITDYRPKEKTVLYTNEKAPVVNLDTISIMTWNIGYCGMDESMDFFYDGGKQTRVSKKRTYANIADVKNFLREQSGKLDFILLQEVDIKAKRSYRTNQLDTLSNALKNFKVFFGKNYDVFFIPVPVSKPYGKVVAGIATFTKPEPEKATRFQYPGNYSFPTYLFMLDRCFLETRYKLPNGKELLVINLHNSAFDDGTLRLQQLEYLRKYIDAEYEKGNYLIIGGDWNQSPPDFKPAYVSEFVDDTVTNSVIEADAFDKGWKFVYDATKPTNRRSNVVYDKKTTPTTLIDFFLISPNVEALTVKTIDLNFKNTDHNPVIAKFVLK